MININKYKSSAVLQTNNKGLKYFIIMRRFMTEDYRDSVSYYRRTEM